MDTLEARKLRKGCRVYYSTTPLEPGEKPIEGTVIKVLNMGFEVKWDDRQQYTYGFVHATAIHLVPEVWP